MLPVTPNCYQEKGAIGKPLLSGKQCYQERQAAIRKRALSGKAFMCNRAIGLRGNQRYQESSAIGNTKLQSGKQCYQEEQCYRE